MSADNMASSDDPTATRPPAPVKTPSRSRFKNLFHKNSSSSSVHEKTDSSSSPQPFTPTSTDEANQNRDESSKRSFRVLSRPKSIGGLRRPISGPEPSQDVPVPALPSTLTIPDPTPRDSTSSTMALHNRTPSNEVGGHSSLELSAQPNSTKRLSLDIAAAVSHSAPSEKRQSGVEAHILAASAAVNTKTELSKTQAFVDRALDFGGDAFTRLNTFYANNSDALGAATSSLASASTGFQEFEQAIGGFTEVAKTMMIGLDALAQVHPFVGIAVQAFKVVIQFDLQRRDNNKKVFVVKLQMKDMVAVLFELRTIRDPADKGPDGLTLEGRMQTLMTNIAKAIRAGGSAIDVYLGKSLVSKTIKAMKYKSMLADMAGKFEQYKEDIKFALQMHTAHGVDNANKKLDNQAQVLAALASKLDRFMDQLDTTRERDMKSFISQQPTGAKGVLDDNKLLKVLIQKSGEGTAAVTGGKISRNEDDDLDLARKMLTKDLQESVREELEKNAVRFEGKLSLMETHLKDAILTSESKIIDAVQDGAHKDITNETLREIWKDMGWKSTSVKARHFILALHDHFNYKLKEELNKPAEDAPPAPQQAEGGHGDEASTDSGSHKDADSLAEQAAEGSILVPPLNFQDPMEARALDIWALNFLTVTHAQSILEAIDDDGTGFITVKEVNDFVQGRPDGWSLPFWLAFWGVGWHVTITIYRAKIYRIIQEIYQLLKEVLPENRLAAEDYENQYAFARLERMLSYTQVADSSVLGSDVTLQRMVTEYMEKETAELEFSLNMVKYNLDTDAMRLLTGKHRVERWIFPVLYLVLKRHLQLFRLAKTFYVQPAEWQIAGESLAVLDTMVVDRVGILTAIFKQTHSNIEYRFENYAFGMFRGLYSNKVQDWSSDSRVLSFYYEPFFWQPEEPEAVKDPSLSALQYGLQSYIDYDYDDEPTLEPAQSVVPYQGSWSGHFFMSKSDGVDELESAHGPMQITLEPDEDATMTSMVWGYVVTYAGAALVQFRITNELFDSSTKIVDIEMYISYVGDSIQDRIVGTGTLDLERDVITGTWSSTWEDDVSRGIHEGFYSNIAALERTSENMPEAESEPFASNDDTVAATSEAEASGLYGNVTAGEEDNVVADDAESPPTPRQTFHFTRTPSAVSSHRYSNKDFTANPSKARWRFACDAVLQQVRQKRLSWSILLERKRTKERVVELGTQALMHLYEPLPGQHGPSAEEFDELKNILTHSTPADGACFGALIKRKVTERRNVFGVLCDKCYHMVIRKRFSCIECVDEAFSDIIGKSLWTFLNFSWFSLTTGPDICVNCLGYSIDQRNFEHSTEHTIAILPESSNLYLQRDIEIARDVTQIVNSDMRDRHLFRAGPQGDERFDETRGPPCRDCKKKVTLPFWYCYYCDNGYICDTCFVSQSKLEHDVDHSIVRIANVVVKSDFSMEDRMAALEAKIAALETKTIHHFNERFEAMEAKSINHLNERFKALEKKVDSRLDEMHSLLGQISQKLLG
ncbi:hypothetical protein DL96DRAFT_1820736 [Flagelloscypha sp. PMI_526]|nr:hypothetical protein DL96DRAFT_1820736 [Flagelloscypha sp. PMI_526]